MREVSGPGRLVCFSRIFNTKVCFGANLSSQLNQLLKNKKALLKNWVTESGH